MRFGKCANMGTFSRSRFLREGFSPRQLGSGSTVWHQPYKICIATFLPEFIVDAKQYITSQITGKKSGNQQFVRTGHDTNKKIHFDQLQSTAELIRRYCLPQRKLHILKFCRKEERSFEWSILMKRKIEQTYSDIIAKHANGRV